MITWRELLEREKLMAKVVGRFFRCLVLKMDDDDVLFLASGLAFNIICCLIPTLLLFIFILGHVFQYAQVSIFVDHLLKQAFPAQPTAVTIQREIGVLLQEVVSNPQSFGVVSLVVLLIVSASLFSSLRSVLHRVFQVKSRLHFLITYLVDVSLVLGLTLLILMTMILNWLYRGIMKFEQVLPAKITALHHFLWMIPDFVSLGMIIFFCYLLYRFVPVVWTPRRTSLLAAVTTGLIWEVSGRIFAYYLTSLATYSNLYGAYAILVIFMIWIFYSSLIFVVGAEVGQVWEKRKGWDGEIKRRG